MRPADLILEIGDSPCLVARTERGEYFLSDVPTDNLTNDELTGIASRAKQAGLVVMMLRAYE
jgi:hypothetical protein